MEDQALKWWHVRWGLAGRIVFRFAILSGKIIGPLCLIAAVGCGVLYLLQPWLLSRHLAKFDPQLSIIPVSLSNNVEALSTNSSIENHSFMFRLPDHGVVSTTNLEPRTLLRFPNGMLEFQGPLRDEDSIVFSSAHNDKDVEKLLSQEMLRSQFKLLQEAMLATPEQVKWWRFRCSQNKRAALLLLLKFIALTEYSPLHSLTTRPIYTIGFGRFRGFQFGNPAIPPYDAHVDLFDGDDRHLSFDISGFQGHGQVLNQEEINALIASIRMTSGR